MKTQVKPKYMLRANVPRHKTAAKTTEGQASRAGEHRRRRWALSPRGGSRGTDNRALAPHPLLSPPALLKGLDGSNDTPTLWSFSASGRGESQGKYNPRTLSTVAVKKLHTPQWSASALDWSSLLVGPLTKKKVLFGLSNKSAFFYIYFRNNPTWVYTFILAY